MKAGRLCYSAYATPVHLHWLLFIPAIAYQFLALYSELRYLHRRKRPTLLLASSEGISVLKPLRGLDPNSYPAFVSQIQQDYPKFEVLFGAADADDPALALVHRLIAEFPSAPVRIILGHSKAGSNTTGEKTRNGKVGLLLNLSQHARYPMRVVNDSDIKVGPDYLSQIIAPLLNDHGIGLVTCPYRVQAHTLPAAWEALGIETDFMPSALVAQTLGVREFGFGSTLAFRAADFEAVGGFAAISDYLADDYQLAKRITSSGKRATLSAYVVETSLSESSWAGVWQHQLRWARTIRMSKSGYLGLPITHAGLWILLALGGTLWKIALLLLLLRIISAYIASNLVLNSPRRLVYCCLSPVWDLYSFCIWIAAYAGNKVRWRDRLLEIDSDGRIRD